MTNELKSCPFCGAPVVLRYYNGTGSRGHYSVECSDWKCPSRNGDTHDIDRVIRNWNTRYPGDVLENPNDI